MNVDAWLRLLLVFAFCSLGASWDYSTNGAGWNGQGQCGAPSQQSPIDLPVYAPKSLNKNKLFLKYPNVEVPFQLYHNGNSIAFTLPEAYKAGLGLSEDLGTLDSKDGNAYRLWQVNFHAPSEHTLHGKQMPLEMQMMHQRVTGGGPETAVVVVLFADAPNAYLGLLDHLMAGGLPDRAWEEKRVKPGLNFGAVVGGSGYYHYTGSLTVPPCEGSVKYFVRQFPVNAANAQLQKFHRILKDTCGPKGNFRLVRPLTSVLNLIPAVDVVKDEGRTFKPKVAKADKPPKPPPPAKPPSDAEKKDTWIASNCVGTPWFEEKYKNKWRIQVGDSPEWIAAKEKYNRVHREMQAAEAARGGAERAFKFASSMYNGAPGLAEKINAKWGLVGAKAVYDGAVANSNALNGKAQMEFEILIAALKEECYRKLYKKGGAPKESASEEEEEPAPAAPPPLKLEPYVYPAPHVKLPTGLAASPFASKEDSDDVATETGMSADDINSQASIAKIAPNLHQPDVSPSSITAEAPGGKGVKVGKAAEPQEIRLKLDLPIPQAAIADKASFKKSLLKALAKSGKFSADRLSVEKLKSTAVANVHGSMSSLQETPGRRVQTTRSFLEPPSRQ